MSTLSHVTVTFDMPADVRAVVKLCSLPDQTLPYELRGEPIELLTSFPAVACGKCQLRFSVLLANTPRLDFSQHADKRIFVGHRTEEPSHLVPLRAELHEMLRILSG